MVESEAAPERGRTPRATSIVRRLAGKKVLVTGVTGFLGQAVLERLLTDFPQTRVAVLIRPQLGSSGRQRLETLVSRPTFEPLRDAVGADGVPQVLDER
ncbi:MAG: SDR family oxidoreductase, partial [Candidatus Velamenicoccus archaeovorus]